MRIAGSFAFIFALLVSIGVGAADLGQVTDLSSDIDDLELYVGIDDYDPARIVEAEALALPTDILAESDNGMLQIEVDGEAFWVIVDDVATTMVRAVDAGCDPQVAGDLVAHGKRGAGEDCE